MKIASLKGILVSTLFVFMAACTNQQDQNEIQDLNIQKVDPTRAITVVTHDGQPIAGAEVLIGYSGTTLVTNVNGQIEVPESWQNEEPITVDANGFVRVTYLGQMPQAQTIKMKKFVLPNQKFEMTGITAGYADLSKDKFADFALIMPALTKQELFNFNMAMVMSPEMDKLEVIGPDSEIPSNVSLPKQKESYILPITLDKPSYRFFFNEAGQKRVYAARGKFNFKDVIKEMNNKTPFPMLVNHFKIGGGSIRDVMIEKPQTKIDFNVGEINYTEQKSFMAPTFTKDDYVISASVGDFSGYLIPTDVKTPDSGKTTTLSVASQQPQYLLGVLKKQADMVESAPASTPISASLVEFGTSNKMDVLPLISKPQMDATMSKEISITVPHNVMNIHETAMYLSLSQFQVINPAKPQVENVTLYWEVYAPHWQNKIELPNMPIQITGSKRWAVSFVGSTKSNAKTLGPAILEDATHVTTNYLDF